MFNSPSLPPLRPRCSLWFNSSEHSNPTPDLVGVLVGVLYGILTLLLIYQGLILSGNMLGSLLGSLLGHRK